MSGNLQRDLLSRRVPSCHFDLGRRFDEFPSGAIPRLPDLGQEILSAVSVADPTSLTLGPRCIRRNWSLCWSEPSQPGSAATSCAEAAVWDCIRRPTRIMRRNVQQRSRLLYAYTRGP